MLEIPNIEGTSIVDQISKIAIEVMKKADRDDLVEEFKERVRREYYNVS